MLRIQYFILLLFIIKYTNGEGCENGEMFPCQPNGKLCRFTCDTIATMNHTCEHSQCGKSNELCLCNDSQGYYFHEKLGKCVKKEECPGYRKPIDSPECKRGKMIPCSETRMACQTTCRTWIPESKHCQMKKCNKDNMICGCNVEKGYVFNEKLNECVKNIECPEYKKYYDAPGCNNGQMVACNATKKACRQTCHTLITKPDSCEEFECNKENRICMCNKFNGYVYDTNVGNCVGAGNCPGRRRRRG